MKDRTSQGIVLHVIGSFLLVILFGLLTVESISDFSGMSCFSTFLIVILGFLGLMGIFLGNIGLMLGARKSKNLFLTLLAALLLLASPVMLIMGVIIPWPMGPLILHLGLFSILTSIPLPHFRLGRKWPAITSICAGAAITMYVFIWVMLAAISIYMPSLFGLLMIYFVLNGIAATMSYFANRKKVGDRPVDDNLFREGIGILSPKGDSSLGTVDRPGPHPPAPIRQEMDNVEVKFPFTEVPGMDPFSFRRGEKQDTRVPPVSPPPARTPLTRASPLSSGFKVIATESDGPDRTVERPAGSGPEDGKKAVYHKRPPSVEELFNDLNIPRGGEKRSRTGDMGAGRGETRDPGEARILEDDIELDLEEVYIDGEDLYEILRVPRFSSTQKVKKAYRKRALMYHPDLNPGIGPEYAKMIAEEMKKINLAKEVLLSRDKKDLYDTILRGID